MFANKYGHIITLMRNERRSLDELLHRQMIKLRRLVSHAYQHIPFYRDIYRQVGYEPGDLRSIDDLQKLPIIGKLDFHQRAITDYVYLRTDAAETLMPIRTSGSSGKTLEFFIDHAYDEFRKAQFLRPYLTNGQKLTDRVLTFKGQPEKRRKIFEFAGLLREKQVSSHLDPKSHLDFLRDYKPDLLRGYPSVLALLAAQLRATGLPPEYCPRLIFTDSELLTATLRRAIETAFNRKVIDIYGTLETDNIAYECEQHCGYHIAIDAVVMEFLANGRPVNPGTSGEIVCTVLENYTMPFIRYRLNDFGIYNEKPCSCGRSFPLLTRLQGRTHDYAVNREGQLVSSTALLSAMDQFAGAIEAFQIIQEDIDRFQLALIPGRNYHSDISFQIQSAFLRLFPGASIRIVCTKSFHQEGSGKIMPFISQVRTNRPDGAVNHHDC